MKEIVELISSPVEGDMRWMASHLRRNGIPVEFAIDKMHRGELPVDIPVYIILVPASHYDDADALLDA